jgi:hypothetical protein
VLDLMDLDPVPDTRLSMLLGTLPKLEDLDLCMHGYGFVGSATADSTRYAIGDHIIIIDVHMNPPLFL